MLFRSVSQSRYQDREGKVKSTPEGELKEPETVRLQAVPDPYEVGGVPIEE